MFAGAVEVLLLAEQGLIAQAGQAMVKSANGQLQALFQNRVLQLVRALRMQVQAHSRVVPAEQLDRQRPAVLAKHAIHATQLKDLAVAPTQAGDLLTEALDVGEQAERRVVELLALIGELEAAAAAPAERIAQTQLQIPHQHAQARQAGIQAHLGGGEAACLDNGAEGAQQAQVDIGKIAQHGSSRGGGRRPFVIEPRTPPREPPRRSAASGQ